MKVLFTRCYCVAAPPRSLMRKRQHAMTRAAHFDKDVAENVAMIDETRKEIQELDMSIAAHKETLQSLEASRADERSSAEGGVGAGVSQNLSASGSNGCSSSAEQVTKDPETVRVVVQSTRCISLLNQITKNLGKRGIPPDQRSVIKQMAQELYTLQTEVGPISFMNLQLFHTAHTRHSP